MVVEGETAVLSSVTTDFTSPVTWKCNHVPLKNGDKYQMRKEGKVNLLHIHDADPQDTGIYSCDTGDVQSSARLTVTGKKLLLNLRLTPVSFFNRPYSFHLRASAILPGRRAECGGRGGRLSLSVLRVVQTWSADSLEKGQTPPEIEQKA